MIRIALLGAVGTAALLASPAVAQDLRIFPGSNGGILPNVIGTDQTESFRAEALRSDAYDVEASRIALDRSRNPRVRSYAAQQIAGRQATTNALLPPGTALDGTGRVVSETDAGGLFDSPLGLVTAPLRVTGTLVTSTLQGNPTLADTGRNQPGKRVSLDQRRQADLARLESTPSGRSFDALYAAQQAQSGANTQQLYDQQVRYGSGASQRFATEALPVISEQATDADRISSRFGGIGY